MSCNTSIEEYNQKLVNDRINIAIVDYVKAVNDMKYKIDISFIDELLELVNKDECCIHHNLLTKYGIVKLKNGSTNVKRLLDQYEFIEDDDYLVLNVEDQLPSGSKYKNEYYFHPRAFKMCLMRSLNTKIYARYYILLEECIKHYNDYQILLRDTYNIKLKDKIKENKIIIYQQSNEIKELNNTVKQVLNELQQSNQKLDESKIQLTTMSEQLEDIQDELSEVKDELRDTTIKLDISLEDRVPKTKSIQIREYFILLQTTNNREKYKYYVLRGQKRYVDRKIESMNSSYQVIKSYECIPNASNLFNRIKEQMKDKLDICGNKLNITSISHENFIDKIDQIYSQKNHVIMN